MTSIQIANGFTAEQRGTAVDLFWQAFREKLNPLMGPEPKAKAFLNHVADPDHAISAVAPDGSLLGIAGSRPTKVRSLGVSGRI